MRYLVIDTETNGLMDYKRPADAEGQPRVAEFGAVLFDPETREMTEYQRFIKPVGWSMSPETTEVNGLTDDFLHRNGTPIETVLQWYSQHILDNCAVVAFGAQFDCKMMRAELRRAGMDDLFERTRNICLMRSARPFAKFVGRELVKAGGNNKGWVKLTDLCAFLDVTIHRIGPHSALDDARSSAECLSKMLAAGFEFEAEVHPAKNYEEIKANV